jgi:hypothetical protein
MGSSDVKEDRMDGLEYAAVKLSLEEQVYPILEAVIPKLHGWCTVDKAKRLARLAADVAPALAVELGVFGGRSLVAMAYGCKVAGRGRVEGVDPYERAASFEGTQDPATTAWWGALDYEAVHRSAEAALFDNGLREQATIVRAKSLDALGRYENGSVGLLHQDSNHAEEVSCAEVRGYACKMAPGGFWVMDDTNWESTVKAQHLLIELGFQYVEPHGAWGIFQAVGARKKLAALP